MILSIVPEATDELVHNAPPNVKVMDYRTFNTMEIHPYIATQKWESVEVTLGVGISSGYLKQVLSKNIVTAILPKSVELNYEIVSRLIEIYPKSAAVIRSAYTQKKDLKDILLEEGVLFE